VEFEGISGGGSRRERDVIFDGIRRSLLIEDILVRRVSKELVPLGRGKIGKSLRCGTDGCKPIIENDMELGSDGSGIEVQDERDRRGMTGTETNVHVAGGSGLPSR
jgi:hypothetical protein